MRFGGIIVLVLVFAVLPAKAQDHLEPEKSIFYFVSGGRDLLNHYGLMGTMFHPVLGRSKASLLVSPSFQPQYAIGIFEKDGKFEVRGLRVETNLWYHQYRVKNFKKWQEGKLSDEDYQKNKDSPFWGKSFSELEMSKCKKSLEADMAEQFLAVWEKMLLGTRYRKKNRFGLDGTRYHFSFRSMEGQIWSPEGGTKMDKFVRLGESLVIYCEGDSAEPLNEAMVLGGELLKE